MPFNSLNFACFFLITFGLFAAAPRSWGNRILLLASLYAYSCWNGWYLLLVVWSGALDYWLSWRIFPHQGTRRGRIWLTLSLAYNLLILAYFKYGLMLESLLVALGLPAAALPPVLEMPVGISFFTFQSMGYAIDVYRGRVPPARKLSDYMLFVSFFPQMMCGPIERARGLLRQIESPRQISAEGIYLGMARFSWGLFQKVVVGDNLALPVNAAFARFSSLDSPSLLLAILLFGVQLYADFSGYTDMALGLGQMLGFRMSENFRAPYLARNAADVWNRWNITLMAWFRDYVYFPLCGRAPQRAWLAALLVFTLSGLWHGAAWHFALWGLVNGLFLLVMRLYDSSEAPRLGRPWNTLATLLPMALGLLLFRAPSISVALAILSGILLEGGQHGFQLQGVPWEAVLGFALVVLVDVCKDPLPFDRWFLRLPWALRTLGWAALLLGILLLGAKTDVNFLYLQF
ncbi:MAG: MBOAT family protein [Candidatus Eremiobacteraeota bacterium]|nr:MBOAT family protein [Candidatus Eremiobacteraeota bacterium]